MQIISSLKTDPDYCIQKAHEVRVEVFQKGQGIDSKLDFDGKDAECVQVVALENDTAVGTVRLKKVEDDIYKVERLAVINAYRKKGIGKLIMEEVLDIAKDNGIKILILNSQLSAKGFYDGLGFETEGGVFMEAGIPHIKMNLKIIK